MIRNMVKDLKPLLNIQKANQDQYNFGIKTYFEILKLTKNMKIIAHYR